MIGCALIATVATLFTVRALSYGTAAVGLDKSVMLWVAVTAKAAALVAIPPWARPSDRIGRSRSS